MIVFIYAVLVFMVLRFSVTLFNFLSNPKLNKYGRRFNETVSIIVSPLPGQDVALLMSSVEKQDYPNVELVVSMGRDEEQVAVGNAIGKYLLFLDGDLEIESGLIITLIHRTKVFNLSMLNVMPTHKPDTIVGWCTVPLKEYVVLNLFPLRLVRLTGGSAFPTANTGCMFCTTEAYTQNRLTERSEMLLANRLLFRRSKSTNLKGPQLLQVFGGNIFAALIYLTLLIIGPLVMFVYFEPGLAALPVGLIFLSRVMISFLSSQNPLINVLLHPLQMVFLFYGLLKEIFRKLFLNFRKGNSY